MASTAEQSLFKILKRQNEGFEGVSQSVYLDLIEMCGLKCSCSKTF